MFSCLSIRLRPPSTFRERNPVGYRGVVFLLIALLLTGCIGPKTQPLNHQVITPTFNSNHFISDDGYRLPFRQYFPDQAPDTIVIALHGFNDYSIAFEKLCQAMLRAKIACLAYDQRGFGATRHTGLWPPEGRLQRDLEAVVTLVRHRYPEARIFLSGESMGAAVIMTALASDAYRVDENITGAILLAPAVWARATQPWYQRWLLSLAVYTVPGWKPTGEGLEIQATDNIEALRKMARDPLVIKATRIDAIYGLTNLMDKALEVSGSLRSDTLVMYGERDEVIPKSPTCEMLAAMKTKAVPFDFVLYPEGYHMLSRDLQAEQVFKDMIQWMQHQKIPTGTLDPDDFC